MSRWYKRDPQRIREAVTQAHLSPNAAHTLSALLDFAGVEATMPNARICTGGMPVVDTLLVHATQLALKPQRLALRELAFAGFVRCSDSEVVATEALIGLFGTDDSAERQRRSRANRHNVSRDTSQADVTDGHVLDKSREEEIQPTYSSNTPVGAVGTEAEKAPKDPGAPWKLAAWVHDSALELGIFDDDSEREKRIRADLKAASELLSVHDKREIERRTKRLLRAVVDGDRLMPTCRALKKAWDYPVLASDKLVETFGKRGGNGAASSPIGVVDDRDLR